MSPAHCSCLLLMCLLPLHLQEQLSHPTGRRGCLLSCIVVGRPPVPQGNSRVMMCPLGRLLPPSGGGRRQQDHQGVWNTTFPPMLKSQRCWQGSSCWCPCSCSPPCCPFARVSAEECLMQLCRAGGSEMPPGAVCVQQLGSHGLDAAQDLLLVAHHGDAQTPNIPGEQRHCQRHLDTTAPMGQPRNPCLGFLHLPPAQGWS